MYNVLICDHQLAAGIQIEKKLRESFPAQFEIFVTDNPRIVMNSKLIRDSELDILIIDTIIREYNGIRIAEEIHNANPSTQIIFESIHHEYAQDIFRVSPVYYLNKPVDSELLQVAIERCLQKLDSANIHSISLKHAGKVYRVHSRDILYVESSRRKVTVHTAYRDIVTYSKLNEIEAMLDDSFLRCHQSFLVNMNCIRYYMPNQFVLKNNGRLPISQSRSVISRNRFDAFLRGKEA